MGSPLTVATTPSGRRASKQAASSRQQQQALLSQQEALTDTLHHATNRYREGYSPYLEQIDAARALLGGQLTLIQAKSDQLASEVVLHQALSGGWIAAGDRAPGPWPGGG